MKIRNGFVSNSSSTSFTFIFNGDKVEDLISVIRDFAGHFNLRFESYGGEIYRCNVDDIIESLRKVVIDNPSEEEKQDWFSVFPITVDEAIQALVNESDDFQESINELYRKEEEEGQDKKWLIDIYQDRIMENINRKMLFEEAKNRNLNCVIEIGFGDNHGHIQGGRIGMAMDYEGRYIRINQDDLVVVTEQNR